MKKIARIGFIIPGESHENYLHYSECKSLSDFDICIFDPGSIIEYHQISGDYEGHNLSSKSHSVNILKYANHWENEINDFLGKHSLHSPLVIFRKKA